MASVEECAAAFRTLAERLGDVDAATRRRHVQDRTLSCRLSDLAVTFTGRLCEQGLRDITLLAGESVPPAQIRLTVTSDDLVKLVDGSLGVAGAWASGRLRVEANMLDVLRLRTLL